jgi:thymidylate synthase (FAD)
MADIARVSTGKKDAPFKDLFKYLIDHKHWSPFEMASMCVEIYTSRAVGRQILRHRSFSFQEFSQRYAEAYNFEEIYARRESDENRQSSIDDLSDEIKNWWAKTQIQNEYAASVRYKEALKKGISRETARFLLPESARTRIYMHGTIRSWIHYLLLRTQDDVQLEHREVAQGIEDIFKEQLPVLGEILA